MAFEFTFLSDGGAIQLFLQVGYLLCHSALVVIVILDGIDYDLGGYDLITVYRNIALGCAIKSAFLVVIIILLFARNVNRTDDITVAAVDIENSAIECFQTIAERNVVNAVGKYVSRI